ncbi:MAG TPA: FAD-binding oxidoreductase, partial [Micromonospora sp.]
MTVTRSSPSSTGQTDRMRISDRLADICGPDFTRPAGAADEVAGTPARWVAAPPDATGVGELLRLAGEHGLSVVPRGAGTKLDWGATPSTVDVVLDTGRLAGVWHQPRTELVAEVGAGTPLRAVQAVLERSGRRLAVDVPSDDATIGGVLAADETGPLRHRHGTACEQLVGLSYVDAEGRLTHAGGWAPGEGPTRELARLLCGSQGALGVLVSATLRVQPLPAGRLWLSHPIWTPLQMHDLVETILGEPSLEPAAVEVDLPGSRPRPGTPAHPASPAHSAWRNHPANRGRLSGPVGHLTVLLEGGRTQVTDRVARLRRLLGRQVQESTAPPTWWRRYPFESDEVALRLEVPPPHLHAA